MKSYPIKKNKDDQGRILTYTVVLPTFEMEFNTLKEAKLMALIIN